MLDSTQKLFDRLNELAADNPELKEISDRLLSSFKIQDEVNVDYVRKIFSITDRLKLVSKNIVSKSRECKTIKSQVDEVIDFALDKKR